MSKKISFKLSAVAAAYVKQESPKADRLMAARGEVEFVPADRGVVLFFLSRDADPEVRSEAQKMLRGVTESQVLELVSSPEVHPRVLDLLARLHFMKSAVAYSIARHENTEKDTISFLVEKGAVDASSCQKDGASDLDQDEGLDVGDLPADEDFDNDGGEVDEESEVFQSKYQLAQEMGVADKIKIAQTGDKEWRTILIKDSNKLVSGTVIRNPRITDAEILTISKMSVPNDEILRLICANKEWTKKYPIRKALSENNKTPLPSALRFLATLTDKDLAGIAKSKNVSTVLATQARRILMNKKKDR